MGSGQGPWVEDSRVVDIGPIRSLPMLSLGRGKAAILIHFRLNMPRCGVSSNSLPRLCANRTLLAHCGSAAQRRDASDVTSAAFSVLSRMTPCLRPSRRVQWPSYDTRS
jgi:hypothetical protein